MRLPNVSRTPASPRPRPGDFLGWKELEGLQSKPQLDAFPTLGRDLPVRRASLLRCAFLCSPSTPQAWSLVHPSLGHSPPRHSGLERLPGLQGCVGGAEGDRRSRCRLPDPLPCGPSLRSRHLSRWPATVGLSVRLRSCQPGPTSCPGISGAKGRTSVILLNPQGGSLRSPLWLPQPYPP